MLTQYIPTSLFGRLTAAFEVLVLEKVVVGDWTEGVVFDADIGVLRTDPTEEEGTEFGRGTLRRP
jgi:hypothetical protein